MSQLKLKQGEQVRVLVVDDEISIVNFIEDTLAGHGCEVEPYVDSQVALDSLPAEAFDLALIDINMPAVDGIQLSKAFLKHNRDAEIIIITGVPDENNLDPLLRLGLSHFLFKPFNASQLAYTVYAALHMQRMRQSHLRNVDTPNRSKLVGISQSIRQLRHEIRTFATMDMPVLILGESGTGKEIIAQELHELSGRSAKKILPINCAVLGSLAESELFGHTRGAFTGSTSTTIGHVGEAEGGTLFLDEVGELNSDIQAKLLRFLDAGEYMRVGESKVRHADIRIVAATNRDLEAMCARGEFREDLFYRLAGTTLEAKPLAGRREDIIPLIWHFLAQFGSLYNKTYDISADACACLTQHEWPGNVRQLKQALHKVIQIAVNEKIIAHDVERVIGERQENQHPPFKQAKQEVVEEFERRYLLRTLQLAQGNLKRALEISGMHKKNFYTKINALGLMLKDFHPPDT